MQRIGRPNPEISSLRSSTPKLYNIFLEGSPSM